MPAQDAAPGLPAALPEQNARPEGTSETSEPSDLIRRPDPLAVTTPTEFAMAFTTLREQAGISVLDLARTVGATSSTVGEYFAPGRLPPVSATETVEKILAVCGVPAGPARQAWIDALNRVRRLPGPRPADTPAPYRGLESFRIEDAPYFFGRERLAARLIALVTSASGAGPTVLVGASGCGKTSALQAGLAARLHSAGNWEVTTFTPGAHPLESLDDVLGSVHDLKLPPGSRVAVIVDQFEEIFTLCRSEDERQAFVSRLAAPLIPGPGIGPAVTVVIALRADFYGTALRYEPLSHALQDRQIVVGPMTASDLRRAVTEPARAAGVQLDPGLVELVVHDATTLPLMSYALLETWWRGRDRLTVENYVAAGGISGAVSTAAEAVHSELTPAQRELARKLFLRLVVVSDETGETCRPVTAAELGIDLPEGDAMSEVLERFVTARLLTTSETTVEIAHPAVLTAWPRLRGWLDGERAGLMTRRTVTAAARSWDRDGRTPHALLHGTALTTAREWADDPAHTGMLDDVERAFLDASAAGHDRQQAASRRRAWRTRSLLAAMSVVALIACGLSAVALVQRSSTSRERDEALSRQLAESAQRLRRTDPTLAAEVAVLAWRTSGTAEARSALLDTSATPIARRAEGPGGAATVAASADGGVLAAAGEGGRLRIWSLGHGEEPSPTELSTVRSVDGKPFYAVALNPEGSVVVAAGASGVLYGWDLRTPDRPERLPEAPLTRGAIVGLAFSGNGRTLAVATGDGRVVLYDVKPGGGNATLTAVGKPLTGPVRGGAVQAVAVSADNRQLAVASDTGKVQLWTLTDRAHPAPVAVQLTAGGPVTSLAFSPDGRRLAAGAKDQRAYVWQLSAPAAAPLRFDGAGSWVNAVAFSPDGTQLAVGGADHHARVYELSSHVLTTDLPHPGPVTGATYLRDGRTLVTGASDGTVRLWPAPGPAAVMSTGRTFGLAYLGSDRLVAVASRNSLRIFDVSQQYRPHPLGASVGAPSPDLGPAASLSGTAAVDRSRGIIAAGGTDGSVWLYRAAETGGAGTDVSGSARHLATLSDLHTAMVESAAFSPDGKTLVTGSTDGILRVTDVSDPEKPRALGSPAAAGGVPYALSFSPDGTTLAAAVGNAVSLWDLAVLERPTRIGEPVTGPALPVYSVAFSPDGRTLATGSADHTVRLLDTANRAHPAWLGRPLQGAGNDVNAVAFSADGRTVAAAASDGVLRLWDVADRKQPVVLASLTAAGDDALYTLAFDPAPGRIAAAGATPAVRQWNLDPEAVAARVCTLLGTPISPTEWSRYLPSVPPRSPCRS